MLIRSEPNMGCYVTLAWEVESRVAIRNVDERRYAALQPIAGHLQERVLGPTGAPLAPTLHISRLGACYGYQSNNAR
jgi:hypothetical protein